jgi:3',5'-cyclic AMP phosphodiesterase CpdA
VLTDKTRPKWTIVTFHHPIFSSGNDRDNPDLRAAWRPILEEHGVDLVLQGHDHTYARSGLGGPKNVNVADGVRAKSSNTVYVVSVSGPKMYQLQDRWQVSREASGVQLFQVIRVEPDQIHYEAKLATGEPYDAFTLAKGRDGKSTLTEQIPDTPPIRE